MKKLITTLCVVALSATACSEDRAKDVLDTLAPTPTTQPAVVTTTPVTTEVTTTVAPTTTSIVQSKIRGPYTFDTTTTLAPTTTTTQVCDRGDADLGFPPLVSKVLGRIDGKPLVEDGMITYIVGPEEKQVKLPVVGEACVDEQGGVVSSNLCELEHFMDEVSLIIKYQTPESIEARQRIIGAYPDGIWGPKSKAAFYAFVSSRCGWVTTTTIAPTTTTTTTTTQPTTTTTKRENCFKQLTYSQLDAVPGIGPRLTTRILDYIRHSSNPTWGGIDGLKQIGPKRLSALKNYIDC